MFEVGEQRADKTIIRRRTAPRRNRLFFLREAAPFNKFSHGLPVFGLPVDSGCDKTIARATGRRPETQSTSALDAGLWAYVL